MAVFMVHLSASWNQPWVANPDQDLVFLRDGLRLATLQQPGYSDHPGLVQMLIGAAAHVLLHSSRCGRGRQVLGIVVRTADAQSQPHQPHG